MTRHTDRTTKLLLLFLVLGVCGLLYPLFDASPVQAQERLEDARIPMPFDVTAAGETLYILYFGEEGMQMKAYRAEVIDGGLTLLESPPKNLP
ncbi:MAG: hypothetical protein M3498_09485 [Deinococcota bacterium]|jgi:hypothetical protein|nr:hypothetical protein [Deinococcota bacterium]